MPRDSDADGQYVRSSRECKDALGVRKAPVIFHPITQGPTEAPEDLVKFLFAETRAGSLHGASRSAQESVKGSDFGEYWFGAFACVAVIDEDIRGKGVLEGRDWTSACLGTFSIKPNYPGKKGY